ncbi:MAG: DNA repair protein RecO [Phycisphaerales bacterium]|nr:MAG: DNA repair protein RecO [Phycisphaerales bacterium]
MLNKDVAICIRAVDYSETSQVVTFFTRDAGKVGAIAKGSKRAKSAFDGPIEMLSLGNIVFSDSTKEKLATLTEFEQQPDFGTLSRDLFTLNCCLLAAELLNKLTNDRDPHRELFDSFLQFLRDADTQYEANRGRGNMLALLILFQLALLKEVGLRPVFSSCVSCRSAFSADWPEVYFSSASNGMICRNCEGSLQDKIRLTKEAATCLASLRSIADSQEETLNEIERVLVYHFTEILGHLPKMAKHVLEN